MKHRECRLAAVLSRAVAREVKVKGLSFAVCVALTVSMAGGLFASSWVPHPEVPHNVSGSDAADLVFVKRPESTFVFAYNAYDMSSWLNAYRPQRGDWSGDMATPPFAFGGFAMAYAPDARGMYAVGDFLPGGARLYSYAFDSPSGSSGTWSFEALPFHVYGGRMVFRPNRDYSALHAIPGWLYVTGEVSPSYKLYRYPIPGPEDLAEDGYCPGNTAVIADATPHFIWPSVASAVEYRIQVSTTSQFSVTEADELTPDTTFQLPESLRLAEGPQYWRIQSRNSEGSWTSGSVLQFTLQDGWDDGVACPWTQQPQPGASLTYTSRANGPESPMAESLWATDGYPNTNFWCYSIHSESWTPASPLPFYAFNAMMASAPSPTTGQSEQIYAVFDDFQGAGPHYRFDLSLNPAQWVLISEAPFPCEPGYRCRLAYDPELESLYATVGSGTDLFYGRCAASGGSGGGQALSRAGESRELLAGHSGDGFFIRCVLPAPERTCFDVYDPTGRKVLSRDMGVQAAGEHTLRVTASELGAGRTASHGGVLLIRLTHGSMIQHAKVVLY